MSHSLEASVAPLQKAERIQSLDIMRGIVLCGTTLGSCVCISLIFCHFDFVK